ncbi:MAG: phenylacetate--CoA ligase family protein [candidate division Zixibacteria bacterium]|nr:phenylacetate--CoA ligase family protein [candidate division Zixibacteria bacterium]
MKIRGEIAAFHNKSLDEMLNIQLLKVQKLVSFVYKNNTYYRNLLKKNDIEPEDIKTLADFSRLPILTKEVLQNNIDDMKSINPMKASPRKTSGSTGIPLFFYKDRIATAHMDALMYEVYSWHDIKMGDRQARFWGMPLDKKIRIRWALKDMLLNRIRMNSFEITPDACAEFYHKMIKTKSRYIYGYPSAICEFIVMNRQNQLPLDSLKLKCVITTGEMLYDQQRKIIQEYLNCKVANEYGNTENGIIAFECPAGSMHLMMHNLIVEFIDSETNKPAIENTAGQVVLTELHSFLLPFIRYNTYDMAIYSGNNCSCGLKLPVVKEIGGRVSDMIVTPEGRKISGPIINYTMAKGVGRFRAIQKGRDTIKILIEKNVGQGISIDIEEIRNKWKALVGDRMIIDIEQVDKIPLEKSGKLRSFIREQEHP